MVAHALERRAGASPGQQGRILVSAGIHAINVRDTTTALAYFDEAQPLFARRPAICEARRWPMRTPRPR